MSGPKRSMASSARRASRRARLDVLLVAALVGAGCESTRVTDWTYTIDPALDDVALVEARVKIGGCNGSELAYDQRFARGGAAPAPMRLAPGTYGVEVSVRSSACEVIGRRCRDVELPLEEGEELVIEVAPITPESVCGAGVACVEGRCEGDAVDAGTDAGTPPGDGGTRDGGALDCDCEEATDACEGGRCVPLLQATHVAMGRGFGCGIATVRGTGASQVYCWGNGPTGQLGIGCVALSADPVSVGLPSGEIWTDIESAGHTCVVSESGRLFCWGQSGAFQAGPSATCSGNQPMPFEIVHDDLQWADVGVTESTTCAIDSTGGRYCFGRADQGRFGNGMSSGTPVETPTLADALTWESLQGGANGNFYGTVTGGEVYYFGWNDAGQTLPTGASTTSPVRLGFGVEAFGLGRGYGCQVETGGRLSCWGCSSSRAGTYDGCKLGALGLGDDWLDPEPLGSYAGTMARRMVVDAGAGAVGAHNSTCAVIDGRLSCWGPDENGILGLATTPTACATRSLMRGGASVDVPYCSTPQPVDSAAADWVEVDVGSHQACAIRDGGRLYCWGAPAGAGSTPVVTTPARMVLR